MRYKDSYLDQMRVGVKRSTTLIALVQAFCDDKGLSIRRFADQAGIRHSTISAWKKGEVMPETRSLEKIASVMGMELPELWSKLKSAQPETMESQKV